MPPASQNQKSEIRNQKKAQMKKTQNSKSILSIFIIFPLSFFLISNF